MNTHSLQCDIAIIGAGPTGLTLANLLGAAGIDVILVERNPATVQAPRAVSIDDESLRTLQACGLIEKALEQIALDYGAHYFSPSGKFFAKIEPPGREYGYPRRSAFLQPELEAMMHEGLARYPNVRQLFSHTLDSIIEHADHVELGVNNNKGENISILAKWVAGCDGGRSMVRKHIGATLQGTTYEEKWLIVDLADTRERMRQTRVLCDPARPAICLPGPFGRRRYEFMLHKDEKDEDMEKLDKVKELLAQSGPDENATIIRKQVYTFHARICDIWRKDRIFIAGDAAHLTPPFAGQGMNSGVRDAHALAWRLAAVVKGELGEGVLDSYQNERAPHAKALIDMAINIGKVMMPSSRIQAFFVHNAFRLMRFIPPLHAYFAQMKYKPKPFHRKGFVIDAENSQLAGRMLFQAMVELPDLSRKPLDDIIGNHFALIAWGANAQKVMAYAAKLDFGVASMARIAISPMRINIDPAADTAFMAVRDVSDLMAQQLPEGRDMLLAIRPDRYVMAAADAGAGDAAEHFAQNVKSMVLATWNK